MFQFNDKVLSFVLVSLLLIFNNCLPIRKRSNLQQLYHYKICSKENLLKKEGESWTQPLSYDAKLTELIF